MSATGDGGRGPFALTGLGAADRLAVVVATAGGIGYARKAPGTWGSLPGLALGAGLQQLFGPTEAAPAALAVALALALLTGVAWWSIHRTERALKVHDDGRIVVDEVVGQAVAVAFVPVSAPALIVGFALFRLLDIAKPLAIGWIDEHGPGAIGTLGDDLLAGAVAGGILVGMAGLLP